MKQVLIVQRRMTHYRIPLFNLLREELRRRGISLRVAAGEGHVSESSRGDAGTLEWAESLPTRYFLGGRICWQPFGKAMSGCDLAVVALENKLVWNLFPQFFPVVGRLALWGHGANLQGDSRSWRERFKRFLARKADWWFGYTGMSTPLIAESGFPETRITTLNNSVDMSALAADAAAVSDDERSRLRARLKLGDGPVAIYVGSLYREKCVAFMLEAAARVHALQPGFRLLVVGAGPDEALVRDFAARNDWVCYAGPQRGREKALYLSLADVYFNPGAIGLGILDAFVFGLPVLTTQCGLHGPEIAYLRPGENGVATPFAMDDFVGEVQRLLADPLRFSALGEGSRKSASNYSVEAMAMNFADGIEACLNAPVVRFGA